MTTFTAAARVDDGTLFVSRPLTAPEPVRDAIDALVYGISEGSPGEVLSFEVTFETPDTGTAIGDSISATSSTPLHEPLVTSAS